MKKALDILKACRERGQKRAGGIDLDEAISELEEAMKPKTCELCAYCEPFNSVCFNDKSPLCTAFVNSEYGCIYWERKATT